VQVIFALPATIWADTIAVVGTFNHWTPERTPLRQDGEGVWRAAVDLAVGGRYAFHYLVDKRPLLEYPADGFTMDVDGTVHSLVMACLPAAIRIGERWCPQIRPQAGQPALPPAHLPLEQALVRPPQPVGSKGDCVVVRNARDGVRLARQ
jgi:1,4-alpha-glucan branching enzyme